MALTWGEWVAVMVGIVSLVLVFRAAGNYASSAFLPLVVPILLLLTSRLERSRARRAARALWASLEGYCSGGKIPWVATLVFVVAPSWLLYLSNDHVDLIGDTSTVIPSAISLINEGNTDLDEFLNERSWWLKVPKSETQDGISFFLRKRRDHIYPAHPSGMIPLAVPVVGLAKLAGARLSDPMVHRRLEKLTASAVASVSLGVFFLLALCLVRPAPALTTTVILAVASGMFTTVSQNPWQHDGIILGSLLLLFLEFRGPSRAGVVVPGLICGTMPACRVTALTFLLPFWIWILVRSPKRALAVAVVAALAFLPWGTYYTWIYGSLLGPSSSQVGGVLWSDRIPTQLAAVLLSPGRGLLIYQPWILLAFLPLIPSLRRSAEKLAVAEGPKGWLSVCIAAIVLEVGLVSAWWCWWGGYCWGSRLVMGIVPLCALACAQPIAALVATRQGRALIVALGIVGTLVQIPAVYGGAYRWNLTHAESPEQAAWSWSDAPFFAPFTLPPRAPRSLSRGHSSERTQTQYR